MSRDHQQLRVRVPPELKDALDKAADENNRTLTAEIVYRLQQSFENEETGYDSVRGVKYMDLKITDNYLGARPDIAKALDEAIKALEGVSKSLVEISEDDKKE